MANIQITSTHSVTRREAQLALLQHFIKTYLDDRSGDLKPIPIQSYNATAVKAIIGMVVKEDGLKVNETYLGEGGYTDAFYLAHEVLEKVFPEASKP
jgi:hypothetical protein